MGGKALNGRRVSSAEAQKIFQSVISSAPKCKEAVLCGSYRRGKPDSGDLDIVVVPEDLDLFNEFLVSKFGKRKNGKPSNTGLVEGVQVEFYIATSKNFGTFLQMWTGSARHNKGLRFKAKRLGFSMSQYGLKSIKTGELFEFSTEEKVYERLGVKYVAPSDR